MRHELYAPRPDHTAPVEVTHEEVRQHQQQEQQQQERAQRHAPGEDGEAAAVHAGTAGDEGHVLR